MVDVSNGRHVAWMERGEAVERGFGFEFGFGFGLGLGFGFGFEFGFGFGFGLEATYLRHRCIGWSCDGWRVEGRGSQVWVGGSGLVRVS